MNILFKFFSCLVKFKIQKKVVMALGGILLFFTPCFFVQALTISPAKAELVGVPGQIIHGEHVITNGQNETKTFYVSYENVETISKTGSPTFIRAVDGLGTWINTNSSVTLGPRESKKIKYTVTIPSDVDLGGHVAAIFWGTTGPNAIKDGQQNYVGSKIGFFVLLNVAENTEDIVEKQEALDELYDYIKKTGSNIAYTKLKLLEKKSGLRAKYMPEMYSNRLRPSSYTIRKALYGPIGNMMLDGSDIEDEIDFLTGARAMDETLQLDSINDSDRGDIEDDRTIDISDVSRLQIKSHPWDEMLSEHKKPELSPIFKLVPEDHLVVHFDELSDFSGLEDALKEVFSFGDYFFDISEMLEVKETIVKRLGVKDLEKFESTVGEFAFVSEDISFVPRTNYALILKFNSDIAGKMAQYFIPDTSVHGVVGDYYIISTSQNLFDSIKDTFGGKREAMYDAKDFAYASSVLDNRRDGMIYLSEKFILKMVSPEYRINAERRNLTLQKLDALQYTVLAYRSITGEFPDTLQQIADEGYINSVEEGFTVDDGGRVWHKDWGTLYDVTAIGDVSIKKVTKQEKESYEDFREDYEQYWQEFFDPIGVAIKVSDQLYFHTIILPLIDESTYNGAKDFLGNNTEQFDGVTQTLNSPPLLFLMHLGFDDFLVETLGFEIYKSSARSRAYSSSAISNFRTVRVQAELYYDDNGGYGNTSSCEEGMFIKDNTIYNSISYTKDLDTVEEIVCRANNKEYIIFTSFTDSDHDYCIDSTGFSSYVTGQSETMNCDTEQQISSREMRERVEEKQKEEWDSFSYEEKQEKLNESMLKEFLEEVGFDEEFSVFGIVGDEFQIGVGESIPYEIENIADTDAYIGIKLKDKDRAEEFINTIYATFAEEYGEYNNFGFFKFSSKHPVKNTYNDVEFYMIPTGFINLYYIFQDDYVYFTVSQDVINNLIDGTQAEESVRLSLVQERFLDYVGGEHSALLLADFTPFASYKEGLLDGALEPTYSTKRKSQDLYAYVSDLQFLQKALSEESSPTDFDEAAQYVLNVPEKFLGIPIKVTSDDILFGEEEYSYNNINFGRDYSYRYGDDNEDAKTISFDDLFTTEDRQKIIDGWNVFTGFAIGMAFTEEGLDTKVVINNPLIEESKSDIPRVFGVEKDNEIMLYLLYGLILLVVLSVGVMLIVSIKKKRKAKGISEETNNEPEKMKDQIMPETVETKTDIAQQAGSASTEEVSPNKALLDYIQAVLVTGDSVEKIRATLLQSGWNEKDIQQVFDHLKVDQK